jgi:hypothetical protein
MGHGTVEYCFNDDPEQGGTGVLIGLHRCQSYKVMQRKVSEQSVDAVTGRRVSKGNPVKYNRGDLILTDCNVTGSNYGTPTKPKFLLMALWHNVLLPEMDTLVQEGGPCAEAVVVHQEDNTTLIKRIRTGYKASLIGCFRCTRTMSTMRRGF